MKRHIRIVLVLLLGAVLSAHAQSTWEGNAVVGGFGEFPDEGFYAASNSFPQNQVIEVTNLETGETVDVIVAKRVDQPGIFLVLSGDAARELGVPRGESARVQARPTAAAAGVIRPGAERALSPDPDVNPAATLGEEELYPAPIARAEDETEDEAEEAPEPEMEPEPEPEPEPEAARGPSVIAGGTVDRRADPAPRARSGVGGGVGTTATRLADPRRAPDIGRAEPPAPVETVPAPVPAAGPASDRNEVEEALRVVRERFPGRDRFPPPREDGVATFLATPPRVDEDLDFGDRVARVPDPPAEVAGERPAAEYLGRLAPPLEDVSADLPGAGDPSAVAEETTGETAEESLPPAIRPEDERRAEVPEDAVVTLEPAEARPPEKPAASAEEAPPAEPAVAEEPEAEPAEELPLVRSLDRSRYYLQVGAYSTPASAREAVEQLRPQYPTEVLADGGDERTLYRVLVGPLNEDERGSVLYFVRAMGYRDAFIRQAEG
jgi:hypothetical protein